METKKNILYYGIKFFQSLYNNFVTCLKIYIYMYIYYVKAINEKRGKFEKEGGVWREDRGRGNDITVLYSRKLKEFKR